MICFYAPKGPMGVGVVLHFAYCKYPFNWESEEKSPGKWVTDGSGAEERGLDVGPLLPKSIQYKWGFFQCIGCVVDTILKYLKY